MMRELTSAIAYTAMLFVGIAVLTAVAVIGVGEWTNMRDASAIKQVNTPACIVEAHYISQGAYDGGHVSNSRTTYTGSGCRIMLGVD